MMKKIALVLLVSVLGLGFIGCDLAVDPPVDPPVEVSDISVSGAEGVIEITSDKGTLQMSATVSPDDATDPSVTWSVVEAGTGTATISSAGLLTAVTDETVTVKATSVSTPAVSGELEITISNQTAVRVTNEEELTTALDNNEIGIIYLEDGNYEVPYAYEGAQNRPELQVQREVSLIAVTKDGAKIVGDRVEILSDNVTLDGIVIEAAASQSSNALSTSSGTAVDGLRLKDVTVNGTVGLSIKDNGSVVIEGVEITALGDDNKIWLSGPSWGTLNNITVNSITDATQFEEEILSSNTIDIVELIQ